MRPGIPSDTPSVGPTSDEQDHRKGPWERLRGFSSTMTPLPRPTRAHGPGSRRRASPALRAWHRAAEPDAPASLSRVPPRRRCGDEGLADVFGGDRGLPDRLRGASFMEGSAPLRAVPARTSRAVARVQGRGPGLVARPPGLARRIAPGPSPGPAHVVGRGVHRHRVASGRRVHSRARHGPLSRAAVRSQHLPQGKGRVPGSGLRGGDAAAPARGVQVAIGEPGRGSFGPAVRSDDFSAAARRCEIRTGHPHSNQCSIRRFRGCRPALRAGGPSWIRSLCRTPPPTRARARCRPRAGVQCN